MVTVSLPRPIPRRRFGKATSHMARLSLAASAMIRIKLVPPLPSSCYIGVVEAGCTHPCMETQRYVLVRQRQDWGGRVVVSGWMEAIFQCTTVSLIHNSAHSLKIPLSTGPFISCSSLGVEGKGMYHFIARSLRKFMYSSLSSTSGASSVAMPHSTSRKPAHQAQ